MYKRLQPNKIFFLVNSGSTANHTNTLDPDTFQKNSNNNNNKTTNNRQIPDNFKLFAS